MSEIINEKMGCIIFIRPEGERGTPGVAVYTDSIDNINDAVKRSVFFESNESELTIREFGVNYFAPLNIGMKYFQLPKCFSDSLWNEGKVSIPHNSYRIVRHERRSRCSTSL